MTYNCDSRWCMHVLPRDSVECGYLNHLLDGDVNSVGGCPLRAGPDSNETQVAVEFVDGPTWAARVELHIGGETTVASFDMEVTMRDQLLPWIWFGSCDGATPVWLPGTGYLFSHASVGGLGDRDVGQVQSEPASLTVILGARPAVATDPLTVWMCSDPAWVNFGENVDFDTVGTVAATVTRDAADLARTDDGQAVAECSLEANLSDWGRRARARSWVRPWGCDRSSGWAEALSLHGAR